MVYNDVKRSQSTLDVTTKRYNLPEFIATVDVEKVGVTINRTLKKAYYFLGVDIPYSLGKSGFERRKSDLMISATTSHDLLYELFLVDGAIRKTDNIIDNQYKASELTESDVQPLIKKMVRFNHRCEKVGELFLSEVTALRNQDGNLKELLSEVIELRPSDYFGLMKLLTERNEVKVDEEERALLFLRHFSGCEIF